MKLSKSLKIFLGQAGFSYVNSAIGLSWYVFYGYEDLGSVFKLLVFPTFLWALFRMRSNLLFSSDEIDETRYDTNNYAILIMLLVTKLVLVLAASLVYNWFFQLSSFSLLLLFLLSQISIGLVSQAIYTNSINSKIMLVVNVMRMVLVIVSCLSLPFIDALRVLFAANFLVGLVLAISILTRLNLNAFDRKKAADDLRHILHSVKMSVLTTPAKESDLLIVSSFFGDVAFAQYKLLRSITGLSAVPSQIIQGLLFRNRTLLASAQRLLIGGFSTASFSVLLLAIWLLKGLSLPLPVIGLFAVLTFVSTLWPDLMSYYQKAARFEYFTDIAVTFALATVVILWGLFALKVEDAAIYLAVLSAHWLSVHLFLYIKIRP